MMHRTWRIGALSRTPPPISATHTFDFLASLPPEFAFMRAGEASYFDNAGVLQMAAINVPRFDHDPVTFAPRGMLFENQTTNICLHSEDMDHGLWVKASVTIVADEHAAPDGAMTADRADIGGGTTRLEQSITVVAETEYTASWWVYDDPNESGTTGQYRIYDNSNGAYIGQATYALSAGWARVSVTFTTPAACNSIRITPVFKSYDDFWIWGVQVETSGTATSYIPTTSGTMTRAADNPTLNVDLGVKDARVTYGDDSYDDMPNQTANTGWWPASLSGSHVKKIQFYAPGDL